MKWLLAILVALILNQSGIVASVSAEPDATQTQTARVPPEDGAPSIFYVSVFVTNPQIVSASLISGFTMRGTSSDNAEGTFFEIEPGLAGGKLSVGHGWVGAHGMHQYWKGAVLRTWGDPWGMHANETFVGAEAALGDFGLSFRLGAYGEISGGPDNWLLSGGVGLFF